jgi:AraC-like DNA-binding protein
MNLNQNFSDVIRDLKMKHAVDYLDNTSYHINEIASLVGYDSVDHFSKVFKRLYNIPPTQYRNHNKTQAPKLPK